MQMQNEVDQALQLIGFTVGEERFAIAISEVHEINRFEHISKIPDLPDHVLGVIDLRGVVVPVINLAEKLGISSQGVTKDTRIIIVGFNGDKIGILVDSVSEVLRVSNSSLERPPSIIQSVNAEYICGIIRNNNQLIVVLDFLRLFKDYSPLQTREGLINLGESTAPAQGNVGSQKGDDSDAISQIVDVTRAMSEGDFHHEIDGELYGQIGELAKYINATIKKLQTVEPNIALATDKIPAASLQLSEITKATEEATHSVMGQVECVLDNQDLLLHRIEAIEKGGDIAKEAGELRQLTADNKEILLDIITGLSFQDLTGQKIKSIISLIEEIEKRIIHLIVTFGLKSKTGIEEKIPLTGFTDDTKIEQGLVDTILKEFGFEE